MENEDDFSALITSAVDILAKPTQESFVPSVYQDSEGYWTIGIGTLVDHRKGGGLTYEEAKYLCRNRVYTFSVDMMKALPWATVDKLGSTRYLTLLLLAYQLGIPKLLGFKNFLDALQKGDYTRARTELLDSRLAKQAPARTLAHGNRLVDPNLPF